MVKVILALAIAAGVVALSGPGAAVDLPVSLIAFASADAVSETTNIAVVTADGRGLRTLTHIDTGGYAPQFTRDSRHLIYRTRNSDYLYGSALWRVRRDGTGRVRLPGADAWRNQASPSGALVAVEKSRALELRDARSRLVRRLPIPFGSRERFAGPPRWSPDGRWIAVTGTRDRDAVVESRVWLLRTDGSQRARRLSRLQDEHDGPFSPDSRWLMSCTDYDRCYVTSPKTGVRRALRGPISTNASWLDDSKRIAYGAPHAIETTDIESGRRRLIAHTGAVVEKIAASPKRDDIAFKSGLRLYLVTAGSHRPHLLGRQGTDPVWSPAGDEVAFTRDGALFAVSRSTGRVRTIVTPQFATVPVWAPDRSRIAFTRTGRFGRSPAVFTMRADGSDIRFVGAGSEPAWASDSRRLAYAAADGRVMVTDGSSPPRALAVGESPSWSPDGQTIAYLRYQRGVLSDASGDEYSGAVSSILYLVDAEGGEPRVLVPDGDPGAPLFDPHWSPDGTTIAALQYQVVDYPDAGRIDYGDRRLVLIDTRDGSVRKVDEGDGRFAWSPDGTHLLHADGQQLRLITAADGSIKRTFSLTGDAQFKFVSWSPDGQQFAYTRCDDKNLYSRACGVWVANADGSGRVRVVNTFSPDGTLSWTP
jgi:Tol biopolymer transport system component